MADVRPFSIADLDRRDVVITQPQIREDFRAYEALKNEAERRGVPLQIVSDEQFNEMVGNDPQPVPKRPRTEQDGTIAIDGHPVLPIRESDARNFQAYLAAKDKAAALGVPLEIVGDDAFVKPVQSLGGVGEGIHTTAEGNKCWQIPRSLLRDVAKYQAAKARASEQGMDLIIVDDGDDAA